MTNPDVVDSVQDESPEPRTQATSLTRRGRGGRAGRAEGGRRRGGAVAGAGSEQTLRAESQRAGSTTDELLRVLIAVTGRVAVPEARLRAIVGGPGKASDKYLSAYNLCDGSRGLREIARLTGLDAGNMSRAVSRWVDAGVVFKLGDDARPVHLYRLPSNPRSDESAADVAEGDANSRQTAAVQIRGHGVAATQRKAAVGTSTMSKARRSANAANETSEELLELPLGGSRPRENRP